jgi:hypothetical protein
MARVSNLDFYAILGVHPNAEDIVIRAAFKALAQRYHPDRFNGSQDEAHRRMADLTNAYETLADPARRRKYDRRRGLAARKATFYFKNPARERQPPFTAIALRAAARKAQYYRNAVYVLMVVVVILSAFNVHQHAAQIRELFAWNRPASGAITVATPDAAASAPISSPAHGDATPATTTTNVRILPIGQGITRPIGPSTVEPQAPAAHDAAVTAPPAPPPDAATATAGPATLEPRKASVSTAVARPAAVEPRKAQAASTSAASIADAAPKDAKRSPTPKPVAAKAAEPERPAAPPSAAEIDRCGPELVALGLCNRSSTTKGQQE